MNRLENPYPMVLDHALSEYVYFNTKKNGKNSDFDFFFIFH